MARQVAVKRRKLKAIQMMTFNHPEGGDGLMIIDSTGTIYLKSDTGWKAFDMMEDPNNDSTV